MNAEQVTLRVNGQEVSGTAERKLLDFLREDLRLTAAKNACGSGACGACTVIIDGKATRSCVLPLAKAAGKNIVTVEGLSKREKEVYAAAFAETGAVQCGFCIPGMVMSAKALLDTTNNPTDEEIRKALRSNICRCTGYVKIKQAIVLAAKQFRENTVSDTPQARVSDTIACTARDAIAPTSDYEPGGNTLRVLRVRVGLVAGRACTLVEYTGAKMATVDLEKPLDMLVFSSRNAPAAERVEIDYIHGEDELFRIAGAGTAGVGILLPPVRKNGLFETVAKSGPLPRKSFSIGEAEEKRFYLECRKLF
jgi:aerobic-type carbon monoxide dehydrogenase small subunit (CoxS/CutS family)